MPKRGISLRWGLLTIVAVCWLLPMLILFGVSAYFMTNNYQAQVEQTADTSLKNALYSISSRLENAIAASRAVSYDGVVRKAHRLYKQSYDGVELYTTINEYLSAKYAYDANFTAAFLYFTERPSTQYYVSSQIYVLPQVLQTYLQEAFPTAFDISYDLGTDIAFFTQNGKLYMVRNIMDSSFRSFATLVLQCSTKTLFESVNNIVWVRSATVELDDTSHLVVDKGASEDRETGQFPLEHSAVVDGHRVSVSAVCNSQDMLMAFPDLSSVALWILVLALPILVFVIRAFYRHVSMPLNTLVDAATHVEGGEMGYCVKTTPPNLEFRYLQEHFNSMSTQLKHQFDLSYKEQLALQDARIKALQSQINPHFLNNTLEIINWEARMAGNEKISRMLEALSTMLEAATARDGRAKVHLSEELIYADSYLYIISERFGGRLTVTKHIDEALLDMEVPRLILQPIVENAIEHGLSLLPKGELVLRAYQAGGRVMLEVEQDGRMRPEDKETIQRLLDWDDISSANVPSRLGIRNVNARVKLLYGEEYNLTIDEIAPERILARITLPPYANG